jgi:hypothetical protein
MADRLDACLRYEKRADMHKALLIARVRSDLLEVPTGSLPVIRAFQTANEKVEARFFSWSITSFFSVIGSECAKSPRVVRTSGERAAPA